MALSKSGQAIGEVGVMFERLKNWLAFEKGGYTNKLPEGPRAVLMEGGPIEIEVPSDGNAEVDLVLNKHIGDTAEVSYDGRRYLATLRQHVDGSGEYHYNLLTAERFDYDAG